MFDPASRRLATIATDRPLLQVVVDTEEEFDWDKPFERTNVSTASMRFQSRAQAILDRYKLRPTYVIDYPVVDRDEGFRPLFEIFQDGRCEVGTHLHPWVNPPHVERVTNRNSFPGNLPAELEHDKLRVLTERIGGRFGRRPTIYKAGRYGFGPATAKALAELGYRIDLSVMPRTDLSWDEGPNFVGLDAAPYWFGERGEILEIPMTVGFVGLLFRQAPRLYRRLLNGPKLLRRLRLPGIAARFGLFERITLTPEGITHAEHRRLVDALIARGHKVFTFSYHSPSLAPGNTPYVRSAADLDEFLDRFERFFDYFFGMLGGRPATATEIRALAA
jgi:hypothetical protein